MKKSTILLVVLVYIVSFIVVGFFGIKSTVYDPITYVSNIEIFEPTGDTNVISKGQNENYNYNFQVKCYEDSKDISLQVRATPLESTYSEIYFKSKDVEKYEFNNEYVISPSITCKFEQEGESYYIRLSFHSLVTKFTSCSFVAVAENGGNIIAKSVLIGCYKY